MKLPRKSPSHWTALASFLMTAAAGLSVHAAMPDLLKLTGDEEVPPVKTLASASGMLAASGVNGPVIIPLIKMIDTVRSVPKDAKLSAEQLASYRAGRLYVNVHTVANKGGEIRAQLTQ